MTRFMLAAVLVLSWTVVNAAQPALTPKLPATAPSPCQSDEECRAQAFCRDDDDQCALSCPDRDHDGHHAFICGGDDCDDADPNRFPGNQEIWDPANHDEDCDAQTSFSLSLQKLSEKE